MSSKSKNAKIKIELERMLSSNKLWYTLNLFQQIKWLERMYIQCSTPKLFPYWWRTSLSPLYEFAFCGELMWWRPSWKELGFSVLNRADMKVCNVFTSADHLLIEILISRPIDILQIYVLWSMGMFFF